SPACPCRCEPPLHASTAAAATTSATHVPLSRRSRNQKLPARRTTPAALEPAQVRDERLHAYCGCREPLVVGGEFRSRLLYLHDRGRDLVGGRLLLLCRCDRLVELRHGLLDQRRDVV